MLLHDSERDDSEKFCRARRSDEVDRRCSRAAAVAAVQCGSLDLWLLLLDEEEEEEELDDEEEDELDDDDPDEEFDVEESLLLENEISRLEAKLRRWAPHN